MWNRIACALVVLACTAGCTTLSDTPATTPTTTQISSTTEPELTTSTEPTATTTTLDRISEIEALFLDLERRRLQAILDQDEAAYRAVFANEYYEEESMVVFHSVEVVDPGAVTLMVAEVLVDRPDCIVVVATADLSEATVGGGSRVADWVIESKADTWGFSWTGSGWRCDSEHPLSP